MYKVARKVTDQQPNEDFVATAKTAREPKSGPFERVSAFLKQVIAELKKVVTPTRKELVNYTGVVLVFVIIMMGLVTALDWVFSFGITWAFGDPNVSG